MTDHRLRPVIVPGPGGEPVAYPSLKLAALALGRWPQSLVKDIRRGRRGYAYADGGEPGPQGKPRTLSDSDRWQIVRLRGQGNSASKIAIATGLPENQVRRVLLDAGLNRRLPPKPKVDRRAIASMLRRGVPVKEVSHLTGVSYETVRLIGLAVVVEGA